MSQTSQLEWARGAARPPRNENTSPIKYLKPPWLDSDVNLLSLSPGPMKSSFTMLGVQVCTLSPNKQAQERGLKLRFSVLANRQRLELQQPMTALCYQYCKLLSSMLSSSSKHCSCVYDMVTSSKIESRHMNPNKLECLAFGTPNKRS